jgi:7-cyano-7-deazaguanine reductase
MPKYLGNHDPYDGLDWLNTPYNVAGAAVTLDSDEVTALCPITEQPDLYRVTATYVPDKSMVIESKSWKLFLNTFRDQGIAAESMAVAIMDELNKHVGHIRGARVTVVQKRRGGVMIECTVDSHPETETDEPTDDWMDRIDRAVESLREFNELARRTEPSS